MKLRQVLSSRRFWSSVASAVAAVVSWRAGLISGPELAAWLKTTFGVYAGLVGAENVAAALPRATPEREVTPKPR